MRLLLQALWLVVTLMILAGCSAGRPGASQPQTPQNAEQEESVNGQTEDAPLSLSSPAFAEGGTIPVKYTCDGDDISPPLNWGAPPPGTQSLALIMDDPDAPGGTWVHWVIFDIPPDAQGLPEAVAPDPQRPDGSVQGRNSWPRTGYGGPCPPRGRHRYFFKLYALDTVLTLGPRTDKAQLLKALDGHVLAQAQLMGVYSR